MAKREGNTSLNGSPPTDAAPPWVVPSHTPYIRLQSPRARTKATSTPAQSAIPA